MDTSYFYDLFVKKLKEYFNKEISAGYEFNNIEGSYKIWHNYKDFGDIEFRKALGKCIREVFYANEIFDYYITYEKRYELPLTSSIPSIEYGYESLNMRVEDFMLPAYLINQEVEYKFIFLEGIKEPISQSIIPSECLEISNIYMEGDLAA